MLKSISIEKIEILPPPLLNVGKSGKVEYTFTYTAPSGLLSCVEEWLLSIVEARLIPVFSVDDETVATISSDGVITGRNNGVATVHLDVGHFSQDFPIVVGAIPVENFEMDLPSDCINAGTVITPEIHLIPSDANYYSEISFYSSDEAILKNGNGNSFVAVALGVVQFYVQAYSKEFIQVSHEIYVVPAARWISVDTTVLQMLHMQ